MSSSQSTTQFPSASSSSSDIPLAPPILTQSTNPDSDPNRPLSSQITRPASPPDTPGSASPAMKEFAAVGGTSSQDEKDEDNAGRVREHSFGGELKGLQTSDSTSHGAEIGEDVSASEVDEAEDNVVERGATEQPNEATSTIRGAITPSSSAADEKTLPASGSLESVDSTDTLDTSEGPETPKSKSGPRVITASTSGSSESGPSGLSGLGVLGYGKGLTYGGGIEKSEKVQSESGLSSFASASASPSTSLATPTLNGKSAGSPNNLSAPTFTTNRRASGGAATPKDRSPSPRRSLNGLRSPTEKPDISSPSFTSEGGASGAISLGTSVVTPRKSTETKLPPTNGQTIPSPSAPSSYPSEKVPVVRKDSHPSLSNDPYAITPSQSHGPNGYLNEKATYNPYLAIDTPISSHAHHPLTSIPTATAVKPSLTDSTAFWLILYFGFTLSLTLFNKLVLNGFPFPWTLTGLHALSGSAGCYIALERGAFVPARLTSKENLTLGAFSMLYTINIAVSSMSAALVTVPFHQVVRSTTPLFTILISATFFKGKFGARKLVSLLPVVAGVGFATYGDIYFTAWGLILTLLGTFLAALKTVITNVIQTGGGGRLRLHPLDLLMRMSPLAFIQCVIGAYLSGELERVREFGATKMTRGKAVALLINGIIAFGLNIVSFTANKKAGPLTMTVSANCKQVLTIVLSVVMFNIPIAPMNALGILLTLVGGAWYAYIEYAEKSVKRLGRIMEKP